MLRIHKYPRTPHIEGSRLQPGDEDLDSVPLTQIAGRPLVVEEKVDGANAAISFAEDGTLRLWNVKEQTPRRNLNTSSTGVETLVASVS